MPKTYRLHLNPPSYGLPKDPVLVLSDALVDSDAVAARDLTLAAAAKALDDPGTYSLLIEVKVENEDEA